MTDKPDTKKLTMKQRKWIKEYLDCGNASEAAMRVYDCNGNRETAAQIGFENLRKLDYTEFMEEAGITDKLIQDKMIEGIDATRTISAVNTNKQANGATTDFIDVPDFAIRHKYLETILKLKKRLDNKFELPNDVSSMQIT